MAASLEEYFKWRLCAGRDSLRSEPLGYSPELDKGVRALVLRHGASGVSVCSDAIDLVERADPGKPGRSRIVYVYVPLSVFRSVVPLVSCDPHSALKALVDARVLGEPFHDDDTGKGPWHRGAVALEPRLACTTSGPRHVPGQEWCVAIHLAPTNCRRGADGGVEILRPPLPTPTDLLQGRSGDTHLMRCLHDAVRVRDDQRVRELLYAGAQVSFRDARGWNALHTACAVRPKWPVINQLLRVGADVCARNLNGEVPCDIADAANHEDVSRTVKERMQRDRVGKHMPQATSVLTASASRLLGITSMDNDAAHTVGRRREEKEARAMLKEFAGVLMEKFPDSDAAFRAFDINNNGSLSQSEFVYSAKMLAYKGDLISLFKALDIDRLGDVSISEFAHLQRIHDAP